MHLSLLGWTVVRHSRATRFDAYDNEVWSGIGQLVPCCFNSISAEVIQRGYTH
jgi:hypothetical protein